MTRANLHPNPLSGWSEDRPDEAHCDLCGEPVDGSEIGLTERFEATGKLICEACGDDMGEEGRADA